MTDVVLRLAAGPCPPRAGPEWIPSVWPGGRTGTPLFSLTAAFFPPGNPVPLHFLLDF